MLFVEGILNCAGYRHDQRMPGCFSHHHSLSNSTWFGRRGTSSPECVVRSLGTYAELQVFSTADGVVITNLGGKINEKSSGTLTSYTVLF